MNQNPRSVLFRADGNAQIGLGHVMRCLALADMLGPDYARRFAIVQPAPAVRQLIEAKGVTVLALQTAEATEFLVQVSAADVVVMDGYSFDTDFQRAVRARAKALVYIDDLVTGHQVADVVVNHAGGITEYDYKSEPYTQFLLGPEYAMLRPEFLRPNGFLPRLEEGTIFVCLGGADPNGFTMQILDVLFFQKPSSKIVLGLFNSVRQKAERLIREFTDWPLDIELLSDLSASEMVEQLEACRVAIVSCSTVAYEVCSVNRPFIGFKTAENQARLFQFFDQEKLAGKVFDSWLQPEILSLYLSELYNSDAPNILTRQRRYFDGQSPERFRTLFSRLCS